MAYRQMTRWALALVVMTALGLGALAVQAQVGSGTLEFYANGEDFVRQGFVSKDGWAIQFDAVWVNLAGITAYQTDPPYDPETGEEIVADVAVTLDETYLIDLAEGDEDADPILIAAVEDAPEGFYNALSFEMVPVEDEESEQAGYTLVVVGTAEKDDQAVAFTLRVETAYGYSCGEYVGDERKGILDADDVADLEMTFHFDHVFGDGELPPDDGLNETATGFDPFAALADEDGVVDADLAALEAGLDEDVFQMLVDILPTLGHVGEGHCHAETLDMMDDASQGEDEEQD
jgi:hypothetical protein